MPIDDANTLSVGWFFDRVPNEMEPFAQDRIPSWRGSITDPQTGRWITTHVMNQDFVAWTGQGDAKRRFFSVGGGATVLGTRNAWGHFVENFDESGSVAWEEAHFDFTVSAVRDVFGDARQACLQLNTQRIYDIDLSSIAVGEEFTVQSIAEADAVNKRGGGAPGDHQAAGVFVYLRDPVNIGGTSVRFIWLAQIVPE